jgi:hypothetical protein
MEPIPTQSDVKEYKLRYDHEEKRWQLYLEKLEKENHNKNDSTLKTISK